MSVKTALEAIQVMINLNDQMSTIRFNSDLRKLYRNIEKMTTDLSKLEVAYRNTPNSVVLEESKIKLNKALDNLQKLILIAKIVD